MPPSSRVSVQPPDSDLAVGREFADRRRCAVSFRSNRSRDTGPCSPRLLALPPIEHGVEDALPVVLQHWEVEVQHVVELVIEHRIIRADRCHPLVSNARLDVVRRVRGIPLKIAIAFPRVAVLQMRRLPVPAQAGAEQVPVAELLGWVAALALPVLDLHGVGPLWIRPMQ